MRLKLNKARLSQLGPVERAQAEEAIQNIESQRLRNPLAFYEPHAKQRVFHGFKGHKKCFFGGNQSGKTTGGLADDIIQAVDRDSLPEGLLPYKKFEPPFLCRIMAESFPVLETTLIQKLQDLLPVDQLVGGTWQTAYDKNLRVLYFQNGSKFFFMTYEQEVRKMGGATLDRVHFDEEPPLAVYNECKWRVTARGGDLLFTMTPIFGITWTYAELWQKRGLEVAKDVYEAPDMGCVTVEVGDNPALGEREIALALEGLSDEEKAARKEGRFIALHGLIYADYNKEVHRVPERPLPSNVNVVVGIDPGIRNRTAVVWVYLTHDDKMVVFQEGYYQGMTIKQVCDEIHKTNAEFEISPLYYVIDPAARNKNHQTGRSDQMEYADHGIVTIAGQNSVTAGINRIKERFQSERIFIFDSCIHLDNELQMYRWKQPPKSGEDSRQAPVKKDDHLCFPAGTMIAVEGGEKPIETIRPGDRVQTRSGAFPVEIVAQTERDAEVRRLTFDGGELVGTPNHPVWVDGELRRLDAVRYGDRLTVCPRPLNTQAFAGTDTQSQPSVRTASTTGPLRATCIGGSGKTTTAPSPREATFTTSTATPSITTPPTLSASRPRSTFTRTSRQSAGRRLRSAWRRFGHSLRSGTLRQRGASGIESTARMHGQRVSRSPELAISAAAASTPSLDGRMIASALTRASQRGGEHPALTTRTGSAPGAASLSASTATAAPNLAHANVRGNSAAGRADVYSLKVDGPSEYFANGVLVSNCDALRYAVMSRPYLPEHTIHSNETQLQRAMREDQERFSKPSEINVGQFAGIAS